MTTTQISCPRCQHQYERTYPKPIICPACKMYLHGCYNRKDIFRGEFIEVKDGYIKMESDDAYVIAARVIAIPNAFKDAQCQINLPACGNCVWRKSE